MNAADSAARRAVTCPTCQALDISAPYTTDSVVYLACGKCFVVWPVEITRSQTALDILPEHLKREHSHFIE